MYMLYILCILYINLCTLYTKFMYIIYNIYILRIFNSHWEPPKSSSLLKQFFECQISGAKKLDAENANINMFLKWGETHRNSHFKKCPKEDSDHPRPPQPAGDIRSSQSPALRSRWEVNHGLLKGHGPYSVAMFNCQRIFLWFLFMAIKYCYSDGCNIYIYIYLFIYSDICWLLLNYWYEHHGTWFSPSQRATKTCQGAKHHMWRSVHLAFCSQEKLANMDLDLSLSEKKMRIMGFHPSEMY